MVLVNAMRTHGVTSFSPVPASGLRAIGGCAGCIGLVLPLYPGVHVILLAQWAGSSGDPGSPAEPLCFWVF